MIFHNICFIGLPHAGKTFIGRRLAKRRKCKFTDTDNIIINKYNKKLKDIIKENGNSKFLDIEKDSILNFKTNNINNIISTGGSVIYRDESMNYLKNKLDCKFIYLYLPYDIWVEKIKDPVKRGVIVPPNYSLKDLYNERHKLYEKHQSMSIRSDDKMRVINYLYFNDI